MNFKKLKYCLLIFLVQAGLNFAGQENYTFTRLKVEDGLSQSTINSILQDKEGYIWFGTGNGLNKYNGYSFTIYSNIIDDHHSISSNAVSSIFEDSKGTLWIGTVDGYLNRFNRADETFTRFRISSDLIPEDEKISNYDYPLSFSRNNSNSLTSISEDNAGNLWIGTWGKGIIIFNPVSQKKEYFYKSTGLSNNKVSKIIKYSDGSMWITTMGGGINKAITDGSSIHFTEYKNDHLNSRSLSDNFVTSVFEDNQKNLWICTYNKGLNVFNPSLGETNFRVFQRTPDKNSLANNSVMSALQDRTGYIWIGTFGGGLNRFDPATGEFLNFKKNKFDDNSLSDDDVLSIYEDRSGIIWIGTHLGKGISKLEKDKIKFKRLKNEKSGKSLNDDVVWSIYKDNKYLWVGTYRGGLNRIDGNGNFKFYTMDSIRRSGLSDNHIRCIAEDFKGDLWLGTYSGGLDRLNISTGKVISYRHRGNDVNSIGADQVLSVLIAPDSVFWIGTFGGGLNYFRYSSDKKISFKRFQNVPGDNSSLSDNRVYYVYRTKDGTIWAGTFGGGLNKLDIKTGKFTRYMNNPANPRSLSHNRIMSIYEDRKGRMWISTYGGGLNYFDRATGQFRVYTRKQGLASDVIYGVLEDNSGHLWISSDNGLFKFYPEDERFLQFDIDDGLQSQEFSGGAYFKSRDGQLFFGGISGLNYFYPDSVFENTYIPPVVISSIKISGEPFRGESNLLELSHNRNFLTFEFAALDYTNPADNHYEFMLEGLEKDWQRSDSRYRIANYTNLSPGTYFFKVRGSNNDEIWNPSPSVIKIIIYPPFWLTWWFITLAVLIAGLTIYYLSTVRIKNLLAIEKLKTKLAADLHDNIGAGLTEISILSELAVNNLENLPDYYSGNLKNISETARQLVDNMSDIVWVVNPRRDSLNDLIIRLKDMYGDLLSGLGISLKVNNLEKIQDIKLPMEYKQNLFMILKEAVNNSVKHSHCKKIVIDADVRNSIIVISVKDDGQGFSENSITYGNGIINMRTRARTMNAKLKWKSNSGGTTLTFIGKITRRNTLKSFLENFKEQI